MTIPLLAGDPHDEALRRLLKPAGWVNPTPAERYQLVVIGGGPAGLVCAAAAAGLGAKVALVERDLLGGDCLNVGCVPSKTLLRAARAAADVRRANEFGITAGEPEVNFAAVMERVRKVRAELAPVDSADRYRSLGVDVFLGEGKFVNDDTVEVNGAKLRFGRCVIATGSRPKVPDVPGLKESRWLTNETVFTLTELPKRLLVIGGGPIGCELGQAFARLGSKVTISARRGQLLSQVDDEAGDMLANVFRRFDGIDVTGEVEAVKDFDAVLVAAGRVPNVEGLGLEAAGVKFDARKGIEVDDYLRTANRRVFAVGDACSVGYKFTHAADAMARLAVRNTLFPGKGRVSSLTIPSCTYTDPEVATVGVPVMMSWVRPREFRRFGINLREADRAPADGAHGFMYVVTKWGQIKGALVVGPHAGELVGTLSVAMTNGVGLKGLANTVFPYPTYTEALKKVADAYNRTRLTPRTKWLIGKWLRWFR